MELFGAVAAKGASQLLLNVFIPALVFSKIVPGFTAQNIAALGPLILVACIYQLYGLLIASTVRKIFWVPRRFRNGILVAGACNNWGDLPTAVIMTITASAPFSNGDSDVATALFPLGGHRLIARDFTDNGELADADEVPESIVSRLRNCWASIRMRCGATPSVDIEKNGDQLPVDKKTADTAPSSPQYSTKHVQPGQYEVPVEAVEYSKRDSSNSTDTGDTTVTESLPLDNKSLPFTSTNEAPLPSKPNHSHLRRITVSVWKFIVALAIPPTISIVLGIVIAIVPTLKALFIPLPAGSHVHIGTAPDGLPPLHVIFDTATFIGGGSIPLGLVCLGSALARLEVPKPFKRAPLSAIAAFSLLKMVVGPVFGVLVVEALTYHTSLIDPNDKVLRHVIPRPSLD
ncbi:Protein M3 [Ceratobasidium sp. 392]|nr:Protein M3 [Ceratobasidium sp. 392]